MRFVSSTYDQENRLIRVTTANGNRSEFSYDGMSRRVETREYQANSLASTTRYLYDGLLPIAELDASNAVTRTITRGTDLSGSMQGAGGIGGILATNGNEYSYDGNGNVRDIISASGLNVAHYEYDPFGNKTVSSGSYSSQPYQWSSKEFHAPSGMVYYLYRFYSPQLGRWINLGPMGKAGGMNFYAFFFNNSLIFIDIDGRSALINVLPVAGGAAAIDGPLPIGDVVAIVAAGAWDLSKPGPHTKRCSRIYHGILQAAFDNAKIDVGLLSKCNDKNCCWLLKVKAVAWLNLAGARSKINEACFNGGGGTHQEEAAKAWEKLDDFGRIILTNCQK